MRLRYEFFHDVVVVDLLGQLPSLFVRFQLFEFHDVLVELQLGHRKLGIVAILAKIFEEEETHFLMKNLLEGDFPVLLQIADHHALDAGVRQEDLLGGASGGRRLGLLHRHQVRHVRQHRLQVRHLRGRAERRGKIGSSLAAEPAPPWLANRFTRCSDAAPRISEERVGRWAR